MGRRVPQALTVTRNRGSFFGEQQSQGKYACSYGVLLKILSLRKTLEHTGTCPLQVCAASVVRKTPGVILCSSALWPGAFGLWSMVNLRSLYVRPLSQVQKQWLFSMFDTLSHSAFTKLAVTLWAIWWARRKAIHEEIYQSPAATHQFICRFIADLDVLPVKLGRAWRHPKL